MTIYHFCQIELYGVLETPHDEFEMGKVIALIFVNHEKVVLSKSVVHAFTIVDTLYNFR